MASVPLTLRINPDVKRKLEQAAKSEDRTSSYMAARAIEAFVEAHEFKRDAINRALAEADKGVFVSEEKMDEWVNSWGTDHELPAPRPDINLK